MSKRNGVFKAYLENVHGERFCIVLRPTDSTGKTFVMDHAGCCWTFNTPLDSPAASVSDLAYTGAEVLEMSFYHGTLDRDKALEIIRKTDRPLVFTNGILYRNPTICRQPVSKAEALEIVRKEGLLNIHFEENQVHLNAFSDNDMY